MRGFLRGRRERGSRVATSLCVVATALALLALVLASYAVYHTFPARQDVWISYYSSRDPSIAPAPVFAISAAAALPTTVGAWRKRGARLLSAAG